MVGLPAHCTPFGCSGVKWSDRNPSQASFWCEDRIFLIFQYCTPFISIVFAEIVNFFLSLICIGFYPKCSWKFGFFLFDFGFLAFRFNIFGKWCEYEILSYTLNSFCGRTTPLIIWCHFLLTFFNCFVSFFFFEFITVQIFFIFLR